jgi:hypothetical protein
MINDCNEITRAFFFFALSVWLNQEQLLRVWKRKLLLRVEVFLLTLQKIAQSVFFLQEGLQSEPQKLFYHVTLQ